MTLFPYTTLFRSAGGHEALQGARGPEDLQYSRRADEEGERDVRKPDARVQQPCETVARHLYR